MMPGVKRWFECWVSYLKTGIHREFLSGDERKGLCFRSTQRTILKYLGGDGRFTMIFRNVNPKIHDFESSGVGRTKISSSYCVHKADFGADLREGVFCGDVTDF
jgi:hypothetical protein